MIKNQKLAFFYLILVSSIFIGQEGLALFRCPKQCSKWVGDFSKNLKKQSSRFTQCSFRRNRFSSVRRFITPQKGAGFGTLLFAGGYYLPQKPKALQNGPQELIDKRLNALFLIRNRMIQLLYQDFDEIPSATGEFTKALEELFSLQEHMQVDVSELTLQQKADFEKKQWIVKQLKTALINVALERLLVDAQLHLKVTTTVSIIDEWGQSIALFLNNSEYIQEIGEKDSIESKRKLEQKLEHLHSLFEYIAIIPQIKGDFRLINDWAQDSIFEKHKRLFINDEMYKTIIFNLKDHAKVSPNLQSFVYDLGLLTYNTQEGKALEEKLSLIWYNDKKVLEIIKIEKPEVIAQPSVFVQSVKERYWQALKDCKSILGIGLKN